MSFNERGSRKKPRESQLESMDNILRNDLWTILYKMINDHIDPGLTGYGDDKFKTNIPQELWTEFFHKSISEFPSPRNFKNENGIFI